MCHGIEDTVFSRKVMVAVPVEALVCVGGATCIQILVVLSGLGETKELKNGILKFNARNLSGELYLCGSME